MKVKQLKWTEGGYGRGGCFRYEIAPPDRTAGWRVWVKLNDPPAFTAGAIVTMRADDEAAAKAAAQADYEQRITRSVEPSAELAALHQQVAELTAEREKATAQLTEMTRRRDEWRSKAEHYPELQAAVASKVGDYPLTVSRVALRAAYIDAEARAEKAEAQRDTIAAAAFEAAACVIDAYDEYDRQYCCDGRGCGCEGSTVHQMMQYFIRALTPADALAALAKRDAEMLASGMREAAEIAASLSPRPDGTFKVGSSGYSNGAEAARAAIRAARSAVRAARATEIGGGDE